MLVTVFCAPRDRPETTFALDVSPDLELRDFVALCEPESGIPAGEIQITYEEQPLKDLTRALGTYGVKDGDVVVLRQTDRRPPPTQPAFPGLPHIDFRSITVPGTSSSTNHHGATRPQQQAPLLQQPSQNTTQPSTSVAFHGTSPQGLDDPALLQQMLLSNPHELSLLKERNPPLAEALLSGDLERFTKVLLEQQQDRAKREQERIRLLTADPFDLEAQAKIEEDIRQHNVEENMTIAMEEAPESFGQVVMLYINCKVNGHPVKAFVDSGAQMTIMSQACAERCNIMRLVDRRWAGIAKGVGTQKIIGRVHLAQVQIEGDFLPCSFSILEDQPMDMLLGLDMLKRHQCSIDLKKNVLLIGTTGTETRFLSEAELPECARLAYGAEGREDTRPDELADRELAEALQRSIQENHPADGQTTSWQPPPFALPRTLDQISSSTLPPQSASSGHPQMLETSLSAPATMTQASAPGLCHNQPGVLELPRLSSPGENADSTPHQPHHLPPIFSPSTEVEVLNTSTSPTDVMAQCQDSELEVEHAATKGGVPSDKLNTTLPNTEDLSPIQAMEQEVTDTTDATEARPSYLSQSDSFEMELPVASQDVVSSDRDQPEGEHHSCSDNIPTLATQMLDHSLSAPATMTQASAPGLCHNQPRATELPRLSSPGENAGSTPHQPHPLHAVLSPSTEVQVLNTSTSPAEVMTQCQDSELEVECAATKGGVPSDKLNTTLPDPEDLSPIQAMEQEVTDATDATEARPSYLSQSDSFEMELPVASQDVVSSERDQPEGEHHSCSDNIPSLAAQMLDHSLSAPATMTQASAPGLCHNQPLVPELPHLSSPGDNAGSIPHQPHPLHPVLSPSTEVEILNTSTSPAEIMTQCQDSELEVECAATKGGVPSDKLNTTLPNPEDISPIQTMEQEVTDATDATEARPSYLSHSESFEMELPVASQDVVSSERDQPEGEHHSYSDNIPSLAAALTELHELLVSNNWAQSQNRTNFCSPSHPFKQATDEVPLEPSTPTHNTQNIPSTPITPGVEPSDTKANNVATVSEGLSNCVAPHQSELLAGVSAETVEEETPLQCPDTTEENRAADQDEASKTSICQAEIHPSIPSNCAEHLELRESAEGWQGSASCSNTTDTLGPQAEQTLLIPLPMAEEVSSTTSNSSPPLIEALDPTLPPSHPFIEHFPAEHIQRIQAAGFSATEAAEALQRAHGVVELALLTLLARSITVPT